MEAKAPDNTDTLVFAEEKISASSSNETDSKKLKLLIVDDEKEVHVMTKLVLSDYTYQHFTLEFLSAYSGKDARQLIAANPDAALILLDVVMETKTAGLDVAKFIREELKNHKLRIILRTGQPGKAPENDIILNYDINDYKEKTELTTQKLFTTITTALRSYMHLQDLEDKNRVIAKKNLRLNEEIARRLVAESNLAKHNRSLEKMIDQKSTLLKQALKDLHAKEQDLLDANHLAQAGNVSANSLHTLSSCSNTLKTNLDTINQYRVNMTQLLEKYEVLEKMIIPPAGTAETSPPASHEVMNGIDRFKQDIDFQQMLKKYPGIIKESTKGIQQISTAVNDIRQFISICDEPFEKTDPVKILEQAVSTISENFSSDINIRTGFDPVPAISVAPAGMKRAFSEILKNAFEAVGARGVVSIETLCEETDILVHICDNGGGIPVEQQDLVFKPYVTTKLKKSRGLGLPFAKSVILAHKGSVQVSSSPGQGTTVTVKLPV